MIFFLRLQARKNEQYVIEKDILEIAFDTRTYANLPRDADY